MENDNGQLRVLVEGFVMSMSLRRQRHLLQPGEPAVERLTADLLGKPIREELLDATQAAVALLRRRLVGRFPDAQGSAPG